MKRSMRNILSIATAAVVMICFTTSAYAQTSTASVAGVSYSAHIQDIGWQPAAADGATAGTTGQAKRIEALTIKLTNAPAGASIAYQVHVQDYGWISPAGKDGVVAGTTGQSKRMEAIAVTLSGMPGYSVEYRVHVQDIGWMAWTKDGSITGTTGRNLRLEAIEIRIVASVSAIIVTPTTITLTAGGATGVITSTIVPSDAFNKAVTWSSSNPTVAAVAAGVVTPLTEGTAAITATTVDGGKTAVCAVTVISGQSAEIPVNSITVSGADSAVTVVNNGTLQMSAAIAPVNATYQSIVWTVVPGTGTAVISTAGLLSATGVGTVTVTATNPRSGVAGMRVITVTEPESTSPTGVEAVAATIVVDELPVKLGTGFGKITGVNNSMEYKLKSSEVWLAIPEGTTEIAGLVVGTYEVRYAAHPGSPAGDIIDVAVKANIEYSISGGVAADSILVVGIDLEITRQDGGDSTFYSQGDELDNSGSGSELAVNKTYYFNDISSENPEDTATISFYYSYRG